MKKILFHLLLSLFFTVGVSQAKTKGISLYEQPDVKTKVVATVPVGQAIIPIYSQGNWIKVADPSNGNVGWVEKNALTDQGYPSLLIKTYGNQDKNKNSSGYQVIEINLPNKEQMQNLMKNFQTQQKQFQQFFNQTMQQNIMELNRMLNTQSETIRLLQPNVVTPEKNRQNKNSQ